MGPSGVGSSGAVPGALPGGAQPSTRSQAPGQGQVQVMTVVPEGPNADALPRLGITPSVSFRLPGEAADGGACMTVARGDSDAVPGEGSGKAVAVVSEVEVRGTSSQQAGGLASGGLGVAASVARPGSPVRRLSTSDQMIILREMLETMLQVRRGAMPDNLFSVDAIFQLQNCRLR